MNTIDTEPKIMFDRNAHSCDRHEIVAAMDTAMMAIAFFCSKCGKQLPPVDTRDEHGT